MVPFTALCAWLAVRRHPGGWLLDQIATEPLVFPAIVMSVAFLHVFVNLPIPLYGTLAVGDHRVDGALSALWHALRLCGRARRSTSDLEDAATTSGAGARRIFLRVVLPLIAAALVSCWLFVFLLTVQCGGVAVAAGRPGNRARSR